MFRVFIFFILFLTSSLRAEGQGQSSLEQWDVIDGEKEIGIVRDWPKIPSKFEIPDYSDIAKKYEQMVFKNIDDQTHRWAWSQSPYFTGISMLQPAYLLINLWADTTNSVSESIVILPGLISSSLIGTDVTNFRADMPEAFNPAISKNLVRMMKAYYHADPIKTKSGEENGLFTDHFVNHVSNLGNESFYTMLQNVYIMQLQSLFNNNKIESGRQSYEPENSGPTMDELTKKAVDTFYRMEQFLKGKNNLPNFEFSGVDLINGRFQAWDQDCTDNIGAGINLAVNSDDVACKDSLRAKGAPPKYQRDSAGSFALLGLMAYDRWKDEKYKVMADESLQALLSYSPDFNPFFEAQFNFGVIAAARMNRHYGYNFDIRKLMQWAFSRSNKKDINPQDWTTWPNYSSNSRPEVGINNESWGQFPVFGLWGGKAPWNNGGYAFYMNTIQQATTLAPVAKYYPQYASLFGKYLLHVASNAKAFFPNYMPNNQHGASWSRTLKLMNETGNFLYQYLPYEGLRRDFTNGAIATGDAVDQKWGETNLSFYSGALTGLFAGILKKTNIPEIPMWDLNATDFQAPRSYPTYLAYNPLASKRTITLNRSDIKSRDGLNFSANEYCAVWDSVSHQWILGTTGDITFTLEPGQARVISIIPAGHSAKVVQNEVRVYSPSDAINPFAVIDYNMPVSVPQMTNGLLKNSSIKKK